MEEILRNEMNCPVCYSTGRPYSKLKTINHIKEEYVEVWCCESCQHQWINPLPSQQYLNHLYEAGSPDVIGAGWPDDINERGLSRAEARVLKSITNNKASSLGSNYLEIGVGYGALFKRVHALGIKCYGVEPGLWGRFENVYPSVDVLPELGGFDIFVCLDVLEHLENPVDLLKYLRNIAKPSAKLFLHFPNADSFEAKLRKSHWPMYRPYGHLHFFSRQSSVCMLEDSGWKISRLHNSSVTKLRDVSSVYSGIRFAFERLVQGDQWFVEAYPN